MKNHYWISLPVVAGSGAFERIISGGDAQIGKSQLKIIRLVRDL